MAAPHLPAVADLVEKTRPALVAAGGSTVVQVTGRALSGKSTFLRSLGEHIGDQRPVVCAAPPAGANDGGPLALMQIAAGLRLAGAINGESSALRDPARSLRDKVELVGGWLEQHDAVLLLDEPDRWAVRSDTTGHFAARAEFVADALLRNVEVPRVFTGTAPTGVRPTQHMRLGPPGDGRTFLRDAQVWGPLANTAAELASLPEAATMSPLELRLLVAATALGADHAAEPALSRADRADALFDFLSRPDAPSPLGDAWRRLATVRSSFDDQLLERYAGALDPRHRAVLEQCLLLRSGHDRWIMHETLRADARRHRGTQDDRQIVAFLARHYDHATEQLDAAHQAEALLTVMDTAYYAALAGDRELAQHRGCYVEQLDLLGKTLSLQRRDYDAAVEVFDLALQLDPEDDYAAHYLGFNLDRLGRDAPRAERHYRLAIELNDQHVWWRSRLISFLAERGRISEARREWDDTLDTVLPPDGTSDLTLYETLHGWVSATLLRIGELRFARTVLAGVPVAARERSSMLRELLHRLRAFELADRDGAVVPAHLLREGWWVAPALLQRRLGEHELRLRKWLAGRIEAIGTDDVELRVAELTWDGDGPRFARTRVTIESFDRWSRDQRVEEIGVGRYVEIGLYSAEDGSRATRLLRVHAEQPVGDDVPGTVGPLDRWHQQLAGVPV